MTPHLQLGLLQEQADKLFTQASEMGLSVLSKASSFWKEGKGRRCAEGV